MKMGKTASGEKIWLDAARTSPYDFYQYWLNRTDEEAPRLLRIFSLRPIDELDEVLRAHETDRAKRTAQRELARALTSWVHGADAIAAVESAAQAVYGSLAGQTDASLEQLAAAAPRLELPRADLAAGIPLIDLLARTVEKSKGAARRLITQGGAYLNNVRVSEVDRTLTLADLATESMLLLGTKKERWLVRVV
jgi:tyrosyl-tRNA synthetase